MTQPSESLKKTFIALRYIKYRAATTGDCIGCGTCVKYCPLNIREFNKEGKAITIKTNKTCGGCSVCFKRCPQKAISLLTLQKNKEN